MAANTKTISVRVDAAVAEFIEDQAAARGKERSEFLRQLITAALAAPKEGDGARDELNALRTEVRRLRDDLAKVAVLVLTRHPTRTPLAADEARAVVTKILSH